MCRDCILQGKDTGFTVTRFRGLLFSSDSEESALNKCIFNSSEGWEPEWAGFSSPSPLFPARATVVIFF